MVGTAGCCGGRGAPARVGVGRDGCCGEGPPCPLVTRTLFWVPSIQRQEETETQRQQETERHRDRRRQRKAETGRHSELQGLTDTHTDARRYRDKETEIKTEVLREKQKEREGTRARDRTHLVIEERSLPGPHRSRAVPQRTGGEAGTPRRSLEGGLGWATDRPQPQESHCPGVGVRTLCSRREGDFGRLWAPPGGSSCVPRRKIPTPAPMARTCPGVRRGGLCGASRG